MPPVAVSQHVVDLHGKAFPEDLHVLHRVFTFVLASFLSWAFNITTTGSDEGLALASHLADRNSGDSVHLRIS